MNQYHAAAVASLIVDHVRLGPSRGETLGWLIASILTAGTVNLTRLAPHIDSAAQTASVHRRLERFFTEVIPVRAEIDSSPGVKVLYYQLYVHAKEGESLGGLV